MELSDLDVARKLADAARDVILPHFRNAATAAENKLDGEFDPVTIADRDAETAMRVLLEELRPEDAILGEEHGHKPGTSGRTWVLDPLDGTRGSISRTPPWGVLIALSDVGGPILGVMDQPYIGERFEGTASHAQLFSPHGMRPLSTRKNIPLSEAILFTTFPEVGTPKDRAGFEKVRDQVKLTRYGMDCYAYGLVAAGTVDLVIEAGLNAYDIQAPIAVIEAAGGIVTNWEGGPAHDGGRGVAAATPELHAAALRLLNGH